MQRVHLPVLAPWVLGVLLALLAALPQGLGGAEAIRRQVREERPQATRIEYALPDPELETSTSPAGQAFTAVKVLDSGRSAEVGRPDLPTLVDDIAVARRGEIAVRIVARGEKHLTTQHWVYPVQEPLPKLPGARERRQFRLDEAWYRTPGGRGSAPPTVPFTTTTYTVRGQRYVRIQASPYAYDPVGKALTYPTTVSVEVTVADPALPAAAGPRTGPIQVLRVPLASRASLDDLQARGVDIKTVTGDVAVVYATAAERAALEQAGYKVELLEVQTGTPAKAVTAGFHDWSQVQAMLSQFANDYPTLCRVESIGSSGGGRPLLAIRITDNPDREEAEPEVRLIGAIHGDEVVGAEMSLRFIDYLLSGYASDSRIQTLVDNTDIWILPVMNPDGYVANQRYNASGIDLNRSFPDGAESSIGTVFGGPPMDTAGRPAETVAMMRWSAAHHFVLSAAFHTGALVANYPYDNDGLGSVYSPSPDEDVFYWLAETYASRNGPMWASTIFPHGISNGAAWYEVVGGMQDWLYRYTGGMELTLEISSSDHPSAAALDGLWSDNRDAILAYLEAAHTGICGTVSEAGSGQPVYASIAIQGRTPEVYSDPSVGDYYRLLRPGTYTVVVSAPGYQPQVLPDTVVAAGAATRLDVSLHKAGSTGGIPLIAVHHADQDSAFAAYRDQKQAEGYAVTEVRLTGTPVAEAVRNQIRAAYEATAARYVVLLGDVAQVPTFTNSADGTTARSDLAYALLDPGETFADYLGKDVGIGRISLDTDAELKEYVAKLGAFSRGARNYDLTWVSGGSATWEKDMAEGTHNYVMANYIDAGRYHNELFYRANGSAAELSGHINGGTDAVVYSGHGYETGWLRYDYDLTDLAGLTNILDAPIVFGHCCLTGSFQLDDCFAEQWLATKGRGVAYVGASQNTLWDEDDVLERREFQWLYEHPGGTLAEALDWGLRQTAAAYPNSGEYYFTVYHVFGDPTVRLFGLPIEIAHEALTDTTLRAGPYGVEATIATQAPLASATLYWRTSPTAAFTAEALVASRGTAYHGSIPGQPYGTEVQYYLEAQDSNGVTATHPDNAPAAWHAFRVDVLFTHTSQPNTADATGPYVIQANVVADSEVAVTLHWATATGAYVAVPMSAEAAGLFSASIPGQPPGTTVSYYLSATTDGGYVAYEPKGAPGSVHEFLVDTQPPAFAGLDLATAGDHQVALSWVAATDASGPVTYSIYRALGAGGEDFGAPLATTQGLAYTDTSVSNETSYYYVVRARDALGNAEANGVERQATPRGPEAVYTWSMDSDPGWSRDAGWAYGVPRGQGGTSHGNPDPTSGATGTAVLGYNLLGDYSNSMPARYLTTLPIDCSAIAGTQLRFQRWLNVEQASYDHATIEVSRNGQEWIGIWNNDVEVTDSAWTAQTLDVSAYADGCATFRVRWGMGPTDSSWAFSGWNLDDVQIWGMRTTPAAWLLTLSPQPADGGTVTADPLPGPEGRYTDGTKVSLTAEPADGFTFAGWSGAATGTESPVQVVVNADLLVTARFAELDRQAPAFAGLAAATGGSGQVTLTWDAATDASLPITYEIYRATFPGAESYIAPFATTQELTYSDRTVSAGVAYYYVVRALDAAGNREENVVERTATPGDSGPLYAWSLATDPGWTCDPPWAYGVPQGRGGRVAGFPDPRQGYTGAKVMGYNLRGDYRHYLRPRYLTTGTINCSHINGTQLRYQRWLNVEHLPQARAAVEVSRDGITWHTVWQNDATVQDAAWHLEIIDISSLADGCATLQIRWVMGPVARALEMSGWNLDDIELWGTGSIVRAAAAKAPLESAQARRGKAAGGADSGWIWPLFLDGASQSCVTFGVAATPQRVVVRPDSAAVGAWLRAGDSACTRLLQPSAAALEWVLEVAPAPDLPVLLSWAEPAGVPPGLGVTLLETDARGLPVPGGIAVDLRRDAVLTVPAGAPRRFVIRAAPQATFDLSLAPGWNLVSLPIRPALPTAAAVFGEALGAESPGPAVLTLDPTANAYVSVAVIEALRGYWVQAPASVSVRVRGDVLAAPVLRLSAGWNLVGVPVALTTLPGLGQGVGPWLEHDPIAAALQPAQELQPGRAYWVYAIAPVTLSLGAPP